MRVLLTLLCMAVIATAAAVLVVVDLLMRWLPLILIVGAVVVAVRLLRRRHPDHRRAAWEAAVLNVPDSAAFAATSAPRAALRHHSTFPAAVNGAPRDHTRRPIVIEGSVIGHGGHRG